MSPAQCVDRPLLSLEHVSFRYGPEPEEWVIRDLSFEIREREAVAILGPNGAGKTTLAHIAIGLYAPTSGVVLYQGSAVHSPLRDASICHQRDALFPWLTSLGNVAIALEAQGIGRRERRWRALDALDAFGVLEAAGKYPAQLSGGMRQRVALARALITQPRLLILDEPHAALDRPTAERLQEDLSRERYHRGFALIVVTHDAEEALFLSDRCVVVARPLQSVTEIATGFGGQRDEQLRCSATFEERRLLLWRALHEACRRCAPTTER